MEFLQEGQKDDQYSDNRDQEGHEEDQEEEEEDEVRNVTSTTQLPFSFSASSSGYINNNSSSSIGNDNNILQLTDYLSMKSSSSLGDENSNSNSHAVWLCGGGGGDGGGGGGGGGEEREHMFDKVVTPSDVGKLNRLVIPKQHAERYFPLDSAANEKGLLLNFEDRNGKSWRFRYSYWNSSQSYVMTKGWSRFVKEKKLDAGDIVSFERGVGESGKNRLYIDWRRRPHHHHHNHYHQIRHLHHSHALPNQTPLFPIDHYQLHQHHPSPYPQSVRWGGGGGGGGGSGGGRRLLSSLSSSVPVPIPPQHEDLQYNYDIQYPYHHHQQQQHHHHHQHQIRGIHDYNMNYHVGISGNISPMVIESMPAAAAAVESAGAHHHHGKNTTAAVLPSKRLRLFGVNMEYSPKEDQESEDVTMASLLSTSTSPYDHHHQHQRLIPSSSVPYPQQVRLPNNIPSPLPITNINPAEFSHKGKSASLSFDLDP